MTASVEPSWWVVTDLDGTLLDHSYDWSPAKDLIRQLQQQRIPVIPCTSKTAEEVRGFRAGAGLHDPYIVENGGAVHGETPAGEPWELRSRCTARTQSAAHQFVFWKRLFSEQPTSLSPRQSEFSLQTYDVPFAGATQPYLRMRMHQRGWFPPFPLKTLL